MRLCISPDEVDGPVGACAGICVILMGGNEVPIGLAACPISLNHDPTARDRLSLVVDVPLKSRLANPSASVRLTPTCET